MFEVFADPAGRAHRERGDGVKRTGATVRRPVPHVFVLDEDIPPDWKGKRFCRAVAPDQRPDGGLRRCALPEGDSVHVAEAELVSVVDVKGRILGEGGR